MALRMYDFRCPLEGCATLFEALVDTEQHIEHCPECGHTALRVLSPVKLGYRLMGVDSDRGLTTAADKWARMHVEQAKLESKREYG